ncbi:hypothetical protein ACWC9X_21800 [Streptomyces asoensis]|uniref:hypothetical protein n=1 Tax=Streptomyces TaxID=1883 RepID=UPI00190E1B18|nr:hypothetical protein [Streptomyces sp. MBT97]MBK3633821.1 hypothetical protein [Streptomyces sp. MBT97]
MSSERPDEDADADAFAGASVLGLVLAGTSTTIFLVVGYPLKMIDSRSAFTQPLLDAGYVFGAITAAVILASAAGLLIRALRSSRRTTPGEPGAPTGEAPVRRAGLRTLDLASFVAGARRAHLREEWAAILAGDPGNGVVLSSRRRLRYAVGFLLAALRMRLRDLAAPLWMPVDWLLSAESRTRGCIASVVGAQILYIQHEDGLHALVTEGWGWCGGCAITLRLFAGRLRRLRGIELASAGGESADE